MPILLWWGRVLFATALAGLGVQALVTGDVVPGLEPLPPTVPGRLIWATLSGLVLAGAGAAMLAGRVARAGALAAAGLLFLWVVALHLPLLLADPTNGSEWTTTLEALAMGGAAWALAGLLSPPQSPSDPWRRVGSPGIRIGRFCYGVSLPGFGILHFVYVAYVSAAVPAWIPEPAFWAYATGIAHIAAGLSIVSGILARLGATLVALMFGSWVLILHAPRVAAKLHDPNEWASLFIALAMSGGGLIVAATFAPAEPAGPGVRRA